MQATVTYEFEGCFYGCPFCSDADMGPNFCYHPSFDDTRYPRIVGYSSSSSEIPIGKKCPDWCPVALGVKI